MTQDQSTPAKAQGVSETQDQELLAALKWFIDDIDGTHTSMHEFDENVARARSAIARALSGAEAKQGTFQQRVQPWMMACFGPEISADKLERGDRLLEEVFELLQSGGYPSERIAGLRDYVYGREIGDPPQEVGGVQVTLAAYCLAHDLDMHDSGETELARVWTKVDAIRAKQAAKPTGSALPVASPAPQDSGWRDMASAPKDGTWIIAYRPRKGGGYLDRVVVVKWDDEVSAWVWPDEAFDVYEEDFSGRVNASSFSDRIDPFEDNSFTHWMPLPSAPTKEGE